MTIGELPALPSAEDLPSLDLGQLAGMLKDAQAAAGALEIRCGWRWYADLRAKDLYSERPLTWPEDPNAALYPAMLAGTPILPDPTIAAERAILQPRTS